MKNIIRVFLVLFFALLVAIFHVDFFNILPVPFNMLNVTFVVLVLFIVFKGYGRVVWFSFLIHFFLDIYSVSPFGTYIIAGTLSTLFLYWMYKGFFTNQSLIAVLVATCTGLIIFRLFYTVFILLFSDMFVVEMLVKYVWEMLFTLIIVLVGYFMITTFSKKYTSTFV